MGTVLETALSAQLKAAHEEIARLEDEIYVLKECVGTTQLFPPDWRLTALMQRLLAFLMNSVAPTRNQCLTALYFDRPNDEPDLKILDVFICKLRARLKTVDETLVIETIWGQGWRIPPAVKAKINAMLAEAGMLRRGAAREPKIDAA